METTAVKQVNTVPKVQTSSQPANKDTVSEVGSFQNTLKELETPTQKKSTNDAKTEQPVKTTDAKVQSENKTTTAQTETQTVQTEKHEQAEKTVNTELKDLTQNSVVTENVKKPQIPTVENLLPLNPINDEILGLQQKNDIKPGQNIPQNIQQNVPQNVPQANQELAILPQIINDKKDAKPLPKMAHISKDSKLELNPLDKDLKLLDESLNMVSNKNLSQEVKTELLDNILEENIQKPLIAGIDFNQNTAQKDAIQSLSELNSKISAINSINTVSAKTKAVLNTITMNKEDANFFINMVENQNNNTFQANININAQNQISFTDAKAQALQSSAAVSQALIDKLQESMKTNKPFRVEFDNNVSVVMRVDQNGTLSANFIPGSSAVEQYLRNNIAELRQTFDNKGIEYNELTYSSKKQNQNKQQQRNNKGGRDE